MVGNVKELEGKRTFDELVDRDAAARFLEVSPRTLDRWHLLRERPLTNPVWPHGPTPVELPADKTWSLMMDVTQLNRLYGQPDPPSVLIKGPGWGDASFLAAWLTAAAEAQGSLAESSLLVDFDPQVPDRVCIAFIPDFGKSTKGLTQDIGHDRRRSETNLPKSQYVDAFFDAIAAGKEVQAANALRSLESLDGYPLEFLADLLDGLPIYRGIFPHRLELKKLVEKVGRKRSRILQTLIASNWVALPPSFTKLLQEMHPKQLTLFVPLTLHGAQLKLLADLFDAKAVLPEGFYWRLKLVGRRAGAPVNRLNLKRVAKDFWERRS